MMTTSLATVAVIGSGTMGAGIAEVAAAAGHPVRIFDINPKAVDLAIEGIAGRLASRVARGKLASEQADALLARLHPAHDLAALADADLVIEAASERLEVKTALFTQLAAICAPSTLLTSNTSSISITAIAAGVKNPERVAGLHFFNPAPVMKLVEVVSGLATSTEVVEQLCQCVSGWGKQPVRCRSTPGFIVNRVARPFYAEAWRALEEQQAIWEDSLAENGLPFTQTYVAYPGHSEHQTGLAIDLGRRGASIDFIRPDFPYTGLCQTFRREMARYGLIQRYPAGKEEITGIGHEPWHFRYVGQPHAAIMEARGLTLEEYIAWLREFPYESCRYQEKNAIVSFLPGASDGPTILKRDSDLPCTISGNNVDGFIITEWRRAHG
mgnify:CR=1 FL=1